VNAVCPGWVDTSFNGPAIANLGGPHAQLQAIQNSVPMQRQGSPEEIAGMFEYLASDDSSFVTAQAFSVDGGVT
jgi:dihydroanticapsin dehydrogenase